MAHPSECPYRKQARRALVGWSIASFSAGLVGAVAVCLFIHPGRGNLVSSRQSPSCQNTYLGL